MRISDWSSDVCSSDLHDGLLVAVATLLEEFDHFLGNQLGAVVEHQCPVKIPGVVDAVLDLIAIAVKLALFGAIALNIAIYMDFDDLVGREEAIANALFKRVAVNRLATLVDVGGEIGRAHV